MVTLDELTTPITVDEWKTSIYNVMGRVGVDTTTWKPGAVVRTIVTAVSIMLAALSVLIAAIARSGFLELATGMWLTLLARYQYGVERQEATFATGQVTITNSGGGIYDFDPEDLIVVHATTKKTYRNVGTVHIAGGATVIIDVIATEAGSGGSANPGTITQFETTYLGLSVTNGAALVGLEEESDPDLRVRCVEKLYTLSVGGPREAYSYWAKTTRRDNGTRIGVTRTRVSDGSIYGHVTVTVATDGGLVAANDVTTIDTSLRRLVLPAGATLSTQSATGLDISVACEVWASSVAAMSQAEVEAAIAAQVREFLKLQPIGGVVLPGTTQGYVFADALRAAIANTPNLDVVHVAMTTPGADIAIADLQVAKFASFALTGYHQVTVAA